RGLRSLRKALRRPGILPFWSGHDLLWNLVEWTAVRRIDRSALRCDARRRHRSRQRVPSVRSERNHRGPSLRTVPNQWHRTAKRVARRLDGTTPVLRRPSAPASSHSETHSARISERLERHSVPAVAGGSDSGTVSRAAAGALDE